MIVKFVAGTCESSVKIQGRSRSVGSGRVMSGMTIATRSLPPIRSRSGFVPIGFRTAVRKPAGSSVIPFTQRGSTTVTFGASVERSSPSVPYWRRMRFTGAMISPPAPRVKERERVTAPAEAVPPTAPQPHLERHLGFLQATALNMTNMIGIGPFITIPILMSTLNGGGPQAMLGWLVAILVTIPDGMIWSELGAALPGTGGSYVYLREGFGRETWGRLMAFLFIWQFLLSGPLEIATGYIGFSQYLTYLWPGMTPVQGRIVMTALGILTIALLYRRITTVGILSVALWIVTLLTVAAVIVTGATHFSAKVAFAFPPGAFGFSWGALMGLGAASRVGIYDYLGYYNICYLGEEVKDPGRVIPRSILVSLIGVPRSDVAINFSLIGTVPWREFVPPSDPPAPVAFMPERTRA